VKVYPRGVNFFWGFTPLEKPVLRKITVKNAILTLYRHLFINPFSRPFQKCNF